MNVKILRNKNVAGAYNQCYMVSQVIHQVKIISSLIHSIIYHAKHTLCIYKQYKYVGGQGSIELFFWEGRFCSETLYPHIWLSWWTLYSLYNAYNTVTYVQAQERFWEEVGEEK